jgi:hypothetical protein
VRCAQRNIQTPSSDLCCGGRAVSITYSECISVALVIPACNAHAPYCHLWPARIYNIYPYYLINGKIFKKKKKVTECEIWSVIFSTTSVWNIRHYKKNWVTYDQKCTRWFISPSGMSDLCSTVAVMVTPKGNMSTEGETLQVSVRPYRCSICPFCCVCLGCYAAEFGSAGGTYELPCILVCM